MSEAACIGLCRLLHRQPALSPFQPATCLIALMTGDSCLSSKSGQSPCLPLCFFYLLDLLCFTYVSLVYLPSYHVISALICHFGMVLLSFASFINASCIQPLGEHKLALYANISHTRVDWPRKGKDSCYAWGRC